MSNSKDKNNDNELAASESLIQPAGFTPVDRKDAAKKAWIKPVSTIFVLILTLLVAMIWYIFSAHSVNLSITPAAQTIKIEGGINIKMGERYLMRSGEYHLEASAPGY